MNTTASTHSGGQSSCPAKPDRCLLGGIRQIGGLMAPKFGRCRTYSIYFDVFERVDFVKFNVVS